ncbi:hypothetical protein KQR56_06495 [Bacillus velezensis]|nr:hypothetical protein [Bacillus velezensis]
MARELHKDPVSSSADTELTTWRCLFVSVFHAKKMPEDKKEGMTPNEAE